MWGGPALPPGPDLPSAKGKWAESDDSPFSRWLAGVLFIFLVGGAAQAATSFPILVSLLLAWIAYALERLITETRKRLTAIEKTVDKQRLIE